MTPLAIGDSRSAEKASFIGSRSMRAEGNDWLTPPPDEAMLFDIEWLENAGFNMIRKHIRNTASSASGSKSVVALHGS